MSDTAIVKPEDKPIDGFKKQLEKAKDVILATIPKHLTPERLMKIATVAISRSPLLLECTPNSIVQAVVDASILGLEPISSIGHGYLVPFRNNTTGKMEAQFIIGYKGLIDLARRSGQVASVEAHCVYTKDKWTFKRTALATILEHEPFWEGDRGAIKLVYSIIRLKDTSEPIIDVMTKSDVDRIREKSKAKNGLAWNNDYAEMARKTVAKRNLKYAPISVEMAEAVVNEERVEFGDFDTSAVEFNENGEAPLSQTDQLKSKLASKPADKVDEKTGEVDPSEVPIADMKLILEGLKKLEADGTTIGIWLPKASGNDKLKKASDIKDNETAQKVLTALSGELSERNL